MTQDGGASSGTAIVDINGDGLQDFLVANRYGSPNHYYIQENDGTFISHDFDMQNDSENITIADLANDGGISMIITHLTSYGNDVYMSTGEFEEPSGFKHVGRPSDFGIVMYQGDFTDINYMQFNIAYIINPTTNFKIDFGITKRNLVSESDEVNTLFYSIGLKTDLFNHYYDF